MLPIMPSMLEPSMPGWYFHTLPIGAARFVTNEIMPYMNIMVMTATQLVPFCSCSIIFLLLF